MSVFNEMDQAMIEAIAQAVALKLAPILARRTDSPAPTTWLQAGKAAAALDISDYALRKQHSRLRLGTDYRIAKSGRGQFEYHVENCKSKISG